MFCVYIEWITNATGNRKRSCTLTFDCCCSSSYSSSSSSPFCFFYPSILIAFRLSYLFRLMYLSLICLRGVKNFTAATWTLNFSAVTLPCPPRLLPSGWIFLYFWLTFLDLVRRLLVCYNYLHNHVTFTGSVIDLTLTPSQVCLLCLSPVPLSTAHDWLWCLVFLDAFVNRQLQLILS